MTENAQLSTASVPPVQLAIPSSAATLRSRQYSPSRAAFKRFTTILDDEDESENESLSLPDYSAAYSETMQQPQPSDRVTTAQPQDRQSLSGRQGSVATEGYSVRTYGTGILDLSTSRRGPSLLPPPPEPQVVDSHQATPTTQTRPMPKPIDVTDPCSLSARINASREPKPPLSQPSGPDQPWIVQDHIALNGVERQNFFPIWCGQANGREAAIEKMKKCVRDDPPEHTTVEHYITRAPGIVQDLRGEVMGEGYMYVSARSGRMRRLWVRPWRMV